MRILGFDWDEANERKVTEHGLEPDEVEAIFDVGDPYVFRHPSDRRRHIALGFTRDGRFVLVVIEHNQETRWVRVVTAYEPTSPGWWKRYAKANGIDR